MNAVFNKRTVIAACIMLLFSVLLLQFPLLDYLGYEFSFACAFLIMAVGGFLTIGLFKSRFKDCDGITMSDFHATIRQSILLSLLLLSIPFAASIINMLFVKNCSFPEGVLFYLLIPVVTMTWSVALAGMCSVIGRRARMWYFVVVIVVLLHSLALGYLTPAIYSYNFIYGFFPGFSYDETLQISFALILFRCLTILTAIFFLLFSRLVIVRRIKTVERPKFLVNILAPIVCGAVILFAWFLREDLGFESSSQIIRQTLGEHHRTQHFDIYYSSASFSDSEIRRVGAEHEFRFDQVQTALRVSFTGRVSSYIFPDIDMKRRFIGTGNTNIAKPWRKEIHLNKDSWDDVLKHELVHVMAGEFGMPVIKAHYNTGLVEGLAMAIDDDFGNRTLREYAAAMLKFNLIRDPARLVKPFGFAVQSSTVSYVMMGAFCRYLIDRYGIVHFKELYGGRSVEDVYGIPYERLVDEWRHSLERVEVPSSLRRHVEFYFRRPSIFAKECARAIANLNDRASRSLDKKDPVMAMEFFHAGLQMSWNSESYAGLVRSMFGATRYDSVIALVGTQMQDSVRRSGIANLFLIYADALWYRGQSDEAKNVYEEILALDLSERYNEAATVRLMVMKDHSLGAALPAYFAGSLKDSAAARFLDSLKRTTSSPVLRYLKARFDVRLHDYSDALCELDSIAAPFGNGILDAGRERLFGEACFMTADYQKARAHFWQSLNFLDNQSSVNRINDWLERCKWFEENLARSAMAP